MSVVVQHAPATVAQQQQFYVDVALDTEGASINGIQGSISFSDSTLSFVRAETGASNITLWVDNPTLKGNTLTFSGIIPGGFDGLINPFDQSRKLPGGIVRLIFAGKAAGRAAITTSKVGATLNDGTGTLETISDTTTVVQVSSSVAPSTYSTADIVPPTITASVVSEKDLFDGKQALLFTATDKESGIAHVDLREGNGEWSAIESPYLLRDQSRKGILSLRAYDAAGNATSIAIAPPVSKTSSAAVIIILVLIAIIILYVIHKKTSHHTMPPRP